MDAIQMRLLIYSFAGLFRRQERASTGLYLLQSFLAVQDNQVQSKSNKGCLVMNLCPGNPFTVTFVSVFDRRTRFIG